MLKLPGPLTSIPINYTKNILCGDTPCFDAITDIYVSSVAESGAALEVTMKGFKKWLSKVGNKIWKKY